MATRERRAGLREAVDLLGRNRDFRRLFLASVISLGGDWFLFVAVGALVLEATGTAISIGLLVLAQDLPVFFATPWAGWLADHMDRRLLMIWCDWPRVVVCAASSWSARTTCGSPYVLLAILAVFAAAFDSASSAAIPNVVDPEDLPVANAMGGSLWGTMLAVGAAVGGIITAALGHDAAFLIDAASFAASALLLAGVRRPFAERDAAQHERVGAMEAARETVAYARQDNRVLALISVKFGFGSAGGVLALIVVLAETVFDAGAVGFGVLLAARGVGALIGPVHRAPRGRARPPAPPARDRGRAGRVRARLRGRRRGADALGRRARGHGGAPGRRGAVGAVVVRAPADRARPDPGPDLLVRLRADRR